jgi:D-glycero-alpha-D-manno-heptose-7-phosphate kinase
MIITQTPLRISLFGGGTDFPDFYHEEEGCVLSSAIDKYIFVIIKSRFDDLIRVGYTRTEMVGRVDEVQHELVREALRVTGIERGVEIATMADIPSQGTGLGSSSTVTVGLLNAMHVYLNDAQPAADLARQACAIEIGLLGRPIGKQDQYIAAYGGLRFLRFRPDEEVAVETVPLPQAVRHSLSQNLLLFYTGQTRESRTILATQRDNIPARRAALREIKAQAEEGRRLLLAGRLDDLGRLLHEGWLLKQQLAPGITNRRIQTMYETARSAGALGGKVSGAGGGGFMLLYCPREEQSRLRAAMHHYQELPFHLEPDGSKIILNIRR